MIKRSEEKPRVSYNLAIELQGEKRLIGGIGLVKVNLPKARP